MSAGFPEVLSVHLHNLFNKCRYWIKRSVLLPLLMDLGSIVWLTLQTAAAKIIFKGEHPSVLNLFRHHNSHLSLASSFWIHATRVLNVLYFAVCGDPDTSLVCRSDPADVLACAGRSRSAISCWTNRRGHRHAARGSQVQKSRYTGTAFLNIFGTS